MTAAPDTRRRELAQIHIAKKQLGMEDDTYRDMLWSVARVRTAGDLDFTQRKRVLEHMKACGFAAKGKPRSRHEWSWVDTAAEDKRPMLKKIIMQLKAAGRAKAYADGMAAKMFHVEKLEFCAPDQLHKIVSALNFDAARRTPPSQPSPASGGRS